MQVLKQIGGGLIVAILSIVFVIGGISLAIAESESPAPPAQITAIVPVTPTTQLILLTPTLLSTATQFIPLTETSTATLAVVPTSTQQFVCAPPSGWYQVAVGVNETIYMLAQRYKTSEDALKNGNCLPSYEIRAGSSLYVPPIAATVPPIVCGPPYSWIQGYVVQPGDNLYQISIRYRTTVQQLQSANCMGSSILIYSGQRMWVPNVPTSTPLPGTTLVFPSSTASFTLTSPAPTLTSWPTATTQFIPTASPSPVPPSATNTSAPANTPTPSLTPFPTP